MKIKKILSMIVCAALIVTGIGFSGVGSLKAYADEPIATTFKLSLSKTPVSGDDPTISDCTVTVPGDCHYSAQLADDAGWYPGGKFVGGETYQIKILITLHDGYYLPKSMYSEVSVDVSGENASGEWFGANEYSDEDRQKIKSFYVFANFVCPNKTIQVSFDPGEGSGSMDSINTEEGYYILPYCTFTSPAGKLFDGWTVGTGSIIWDAREQVVLRENTTIYAKYRDCVESVLTVGCDSNKGSVVASVGGYGIDLNAVPENAYVTLTAQPNPGWVVDSWDYHIESFFSEDKKTCSFYMPACPMTVSVIFAKDSEAKTVTLDAKGGFVSPSEVMTNNEGYLLNWDRSYVVLPTPTAPGKIFKYWAKSDGSEYNKNEQYTENTTLYAVYEDAPAPAPSTGSGSGNYLSSLDEKLDAAIASGSSETITWSAGDSLPLEVMKKIKDSDVTLEFTYTYEGKEYTVLIDKTNVPDEEVEWYGPAYLAGKLGSVKTKTASTGYIASNAPANMSSVIDLNSRAYLIIRGDTLSKIAKKLRTTVKTLLAMNTYVTDPNLIYAGKTLLY